MYTLSLELRTCVERGRYTWLGKLYDGQRVLTRIYYNNEPEELLNIAYTVARMLSRSEYDLRGLCIHTNCNPLVEVVRTQHNRLYDLLAANHGTMLHGALPICVSISSYDTIVCYDASYSEKDNSAIIAVVINVNGNDLVSMQKTVKSSSIFGAEHYALDLALAQLTKMVETIELGTILLCGDNQQLVSALYSVSSHNNRRITKTKRKINALGADFTWIATKENVADELTREKG